MERFAKIIAIIRDLVWTALGLLLIAAIVFMITFLSGGGLNHVFPTGSNTASQQPGGNQQGKRQRWGGDAQPAARVRRGPTTGRRRTRGERSRNL